jgi:hypothetical protein
MAENKKSFVAYCDWQETFEELSDEEAGKLVKHLFNYVNDKNPETSDKLTKMCFIPIKQSLKRDLKKYEKYVEKQSVNGKKGGRPKNPTLSQITQPFIGKPKKADSVSVSVSVNDNVINKQKEKRLLDFETFWKTYAKPEGKKKASEKFLKLPQKDADKILTVVKNYVISTPDKQYRKNPTTWLNGEHWNDELKTVKKQHSQLKADGTFKMS